MDDQEILIFAGLRSVTAMFKHDLDLLAELRKEHDASVEKLASSLEEYEVFLLKNENVDVELAHLAKHADYFDDTKYEILRKRILDYGNALQRELKQL